MIMWCEESQTDAKNQRSANGEPPQTKPQEQFLKMFITQIKTDAYQRQLLKWVGRIMEG